MSNNVNIFHSTETEELSVLHQMLTFGSSEQETEQEKLIRTGEMTPFGSVTKDSNNKASKGISLTSESDMSPFEKFLMEKEQTKIKRIPKHQKTSTVTLATLKEQNSVMQNSRFAPTPSPSKKKKPNWFDERKKQFRSEPLPSSSNHAIKVSDDSDEDSPGNEFAVKDCRDGRGYNDSDDEWYPDDGKILLVSELSFFCVGFICFYTGFYLTL